MVNTKHYIKVTTKGGKNFVLLATNKQFYQSQGCAITEPTVEEIYNEFPEVKERDERLAAQERKKTEQPADTAESTAEESSDAEKPANADEQPANADEAPADEQPTDKKKPAAKKTSKTKK